MPLTELLASLKRGCDCEPPTTDDGATVLSTLQARARAREDAAPDVDPAAVRYHDMPQMVALVRTFARRK
jgi:hypothetical protein